MGTTAVPQLGFFASEDRKKYVHISPELIFVWRAYRARS